MVQEADEQDMITKEEQNYVLSRHTRAITQMVNATGYKKDKWKTYIYQDGKRKEIIKNTEEEVLEFLFRYYEKLDMRLTTLKDVFEQFTGYKKECLGRTEHTIYEDKHVFDCLSKKLQEMPIVDITDEDLKNGSGRITCRFIPQKQRCANSFGF